MVVVNGGKTLLLDSAFAESIITEDYSVGLFSNNYTVVDATTFGNLVEATFLGYARVSVLRSSFAPAVIVANVAYLISSVVPTFSCTGGQGETCYGWFMVGASTGTLYCAQNFTTPRTLTSGLSEYLNPFQFELESL
jgi:hypothetical protein